MTTKKSPKSSEKQQPSVVRSSAAEYLTFVAAVGSSEASVEMRYEDENIRLTQKMRSTLYDVSVPAINQHLKRIFGDNELEEASVIKHYLTTASDGKNYQIKHYNLQAIIAVGFKIENERAVQFRKWANQIVKDYTIQGWTMEVERLKQGRSILRDDILNANSKKSAKSVFPNTSSIRKLRTFRPHRLTMIPQRRPQNVFFAAVQNKMHYAIYGQTADEVIVDREDHEEDYMVLISWEGSPKGKIHKYDVFIAKNYLSGFELAQMQRIVSVYLDMAELQAMRRIPMTMADRETRLNGFLTLWGREILQDAGKVTAEIAKAHVESEFEKYRIVQDRLFESDFDRMVKEIAQRYEAQGGGEDDQ